MKEDIACCGYKCKICPAYKDNITDKNSQQQVSDGWFKYYGFRIPPENIYCDGCLPDNCENPKRIDTQCPVRPCVLEKGIPNCAHCEEYICEKLSQRIVDIAGIRSKCDEPVQEEEFERFTKPYDNKSRLDKIRSQLNK